MKDTVSIINMDGDFKSGVYLVENEDGKTIHTQLKYQAEYFYDKVLISADNLDSAREKAYTYFCQNFTCVQKGEILVTDIDGSLGVIK